MSISRQQKECREIIHQKQLDDSQQTNTSLLPSSFMWSVSDLSEYFIEVVLYLRVSSKRQEYDGNLERQKQAMIAALPKNIKVAKVIEYQGSAKFSEIKEQMEYVFEQTTKIHAKHVIAITPSRYLRSDEHDATNAEKRYVSPNDHELQWLKDTAEKHGVQLVTLSNPDLTPKEDAAFISNTIKQHIGKANAGRPKKKEEGYKTKQKEEWYAEVCRLHHQNKWSTRRIAKHVSQESGVKISHETVSQWIKESSE